MGKKKSVQEKTIMKVIRRRLSEKISPFYKPCTIPRYLPGSVPPELSDKDLLSYNEHRYRIFKSKPKVDTKPPIMNPLNYIRIPKLQEDHARLLQIKRENMDMVKKINIINRMGGLVDTFNPNAYKRNTKWMAREDELQKIAEDNKVIYKRICNANTRYPKANHDEFWEQIVKQMKCYCKYPLVIMEKDNPDLLLKNYPSVIEIDEGTNKQRPVCFLTFKADNGPMFGTIYVRLYADYAPVICQNFVSMCNAETKGLTYKGSLIYNAVKCKYIEMGDVTLRNGKGGNTIYGPNFAREPFFLRHTCPGVLSAVPLENKTISSMFSITMCPMPEFNNVRVAFGKIIKGYGTILEINNVSKKIGKPVPIIRIIECGECPPKKVTKKRVKKPTSKVVFKIDTQQTF